MVCFDRVWKTNSKFLKIGNLISNNLFDASELFEIIFACTRHNIAFLLLKLIREIIIISLLELKKKMNQMSTIVKSSIATLSKS